MRYIVAIIAGLGCSTLMGHCAATGSTEAVVKAADNPTEEAAAIIARGVSFLEGAQAADGSWSREKGPGVTALIATSLMANRRSPQDPTVARALAFVERHIQPDGGIYQAGTRYRNYETCLAIMCFTAAEQPEKYAKTIARAEAFIKGIQWDDQEGYDPSNPGYGGAGYGKHNRPDLSNTQMLVEALHDLGVDAGDPAMQRALAFVSRCQNLETEHNQTKYAALNPDGGFYYTAAAGGSSQAGSLPNGGLRSYGSMTYAGLKSMIYAGVDQDDARVKAAVEWARQHYTLEENPGLGPAGLYYYFHTFAKALDALGDDVIVDRDGVSHQWRRELVSALAERQESNGSWVNGHDRWYEGDPNLVTGYALLALSHCRTP